MKKISLQKINMTFFSKKGDVHVLDDFDLDISEGEFVCFVGPSGCGKSTLLRIIAGLLTPTSGDLLMNGQAILHQAPTGPWFFRTIRFFPG